MVILSINSLDKYTYFTIEFMSLTVDGARVALRIFRRQVNVMYLATTPLLELVDSMKSSTFCHKSSDEYLKVKFIETELDIRLYLR